MALLDVQPALAYAAAHLDDDVSLAALAEHAGLSPFHLHRVFSAAVGETPKQHTLRLRLGRAAILLLSSEESILSIALECGFQSHEVFSRAFRRRFGITPRAYRERGFAQSLDARQARDHAEFVTRAGPCVSLYHIEQDRRLNMSYSISKKTIPAQPVLVVKRRVRRTEIAATIAQVLPLIFMYAQKRGIAMAGMPFARYSEISQGMMTIEPGMPVVGHDGVGEGDVLAETLPGGAVATTLHMGPYDKLVDAYAAIEEWIKAEGLVQSGSPWESYVTDPGEYPDPKDWKTEVFWPVKG